jgi:hypothetical protein
MSFIIANTAQFYFGRKEKKAFQIDFRPVFNVYKCFTLVASLIVKWWITVDLYSYAKKD